VTIGYNPGARVEGLAIATASHRVPYTLGVTSLRRYITLAVSATHLHSAALLPMRAGRTSSAPNTLLRPRPGPRQSTAASPSSSLWPCAEPSSCRAFCGDHLSAAATPTEVYCPGRKPAFLAVKRPARPCKSPIQKGFHRKTLRALKRPKTARTVSMSSPSKAATSAPGVVTPLPITTVMWC
jgi:hypothetical protein